MGMEVISKRKEVEMFEVKRQLNGLKKMTFLALVSPFGDLRNPVLLPQLSDNLYTLRGINSSIAPDCVPCLSDDCYSYYVRLHIIIIIIKKRSAVQGPQY